MFTYDLSALFSVRLYPSSKSFLFYFRISGFLCFSAVWKFNSSLYPSFFYLTTLISSNYLYSLCTFQKQPLLYFPFDSSPFHTWINILFSSLSSHYFFFYYVSFFTPRQFLSAHSTLIRSHLSLSTFHIHLPKPKNIPLYPCHTVPSFWFLLLCKLSLFHTPRYFTLISLMLSFLHFLIEFTVSCHSSLNY